MPHDPITTGYQYGYVTTTGDTFAGTAAASNVTFTVYPSNMTSATTVGTNGFFGNTNGFYGITGGLYGQTIGGGGGGRGGPNWEPVQAEALKKDFEAFKKDWKRKRAEVRARRLFRRVVGEVAYRKFENQGYHEITGASRTRYRLRPMFRVQVMKDAEVDYELCAHLEIGIPWFDSMAVQHLMLTASKETEDKFKAAANQHPAHGPYPIEEMTKAA